MYTEEGVWRQYNAFYSLDDMCYFNRSTNSFRPEHTLKNTLPFNIVTGMTPNDDMSDMPEIVRQAVGEGRIRTRVDEDCIF